MRRWNGWGDDTIGYPLPASGRQFVEARVGRGILPCDAKLEQVISAVPPSKLAAHPLVTADPIDRVKHARGQSLGDWIALRSGRIAAFPDGIAYPTTDAQVRDLMRYAQTVGALVIPYGGGTSVVGHINPPASDAPVLTVDMSHMNRLEHFDSFSCLATFGAGVRGPEVEAHLRARGCTLGHFPQSFEYSTLGGWIATRSSGQQSLGYGRIERLFAGGRLVAPAGVLDLPCFPASAAGPDLREIVLGSEGRLGVLTSATVRVTPLPEREDFHAVFFPDLELGLEAVREITQTRLPLSMLRLSTAAETETTLALAGRPQLIGALEQMLAVRGAKKDKCMLILGFTGKNGIVQASRKQALGICRHTRGIHVGRTFGNEWHKSRFQTPYLRNTLWEMGYALDTIETATTWANIRAMAEAIESVLSAQLSEMEERGHVFTHLSHVYADGCTCYTTYLFRSAQDPDETMRRWQALKAGASKAIVAHRGTISHQHGVGADHAPYLPAEKGTLGMAVLGDVCSRFDPQRIMNPGKLLL